MEIYVEYAFLENLCVDAMLIFLSFYLLKIPIRKRNIVFAGSAGGAFALIYPFFALTIPVIATIIKTLFPFVLCKIGLGRKRIGVRKYMLCVSATYITSFLFAGGIYALCSIFSSSYAYVDGYVTPAPFGIILCGSIVSIYAIVSFFKGLYLRRQKTGALFRCKIIVGDREVEGTGFADSGNVARKAGKPVCFLSPDLFYDLLGERVFEQWEEELAVTSVAGDKKIKLWKIDELRIYSDGRENIIKKLWVSPSHQLTGREYKLLFGAWAFEEETEVKK